MEVVIVLIVVCVIIWLINIGWSLLKAVLWGLGSLLGHLFPRQFSWLGDEYAEIKPKKRKKGQIGIFRGSETYGGGKDYTGRQYFFNLLSDELNSEDVRDLCQDTSSWTFNGESSEKFAKKFGQPSPLGYPVCGESRDGFRVYLTGTDTVGGDRINVQIPDPDRVKLKEIGIPVKIKGKERLIRISTAQEYE